MKRIALLISSDRGLNISSRIWTYYCILNVNDIHSFKFDYDKNRLHFSSSNIFINLILFRSSMTSSIVFASSKVQSIIHIVDTSDNRCYIGERRTCTRAYIYSYYVRVIFIAVSLRLYFILPKYTIFLTQ